MIFRIAGRNMNIVEKNDGLIPVLNSDADAERVPFVSQPHPEPNLLARHGRIRVHIQIFNEQWPDANLPQGPTRIGPPGTKLFNYIHRPPGSLNIHFQGYTE